MSEQPKGELVPLAPLWINKSKKTGEMYLSGYLGNAKLFVFKNGFKEDDSDPDYRVFVAKKPPKRDGVERPKDDEFQDELSEQGASKAPTNGMSHPDDITDDEIPF